MVKRTRKRFWQIGCLIVTLLTLGIFAWVIASTNQIPTRKIVTQRAFFAISGPLRPNDEGVKDAWEVFIAERQSKGMLSGQILRWLSVPSEMTVAFYEFQPSPVGAVAINLRKGYRWLWLLARFSGKHYKGAHYHVASPDLVVGMYGGTLIATRDEVTFCHIVDKILSAGDGEKQEPKLARRLKDRYDFVGFINPQMLSPTERFQLPASLGEIGLDIVNAKELRGSVFWVCQGEREAEAMMRALGKIESEISADCLRKGVQCSFRKHREGVFVWWEFRLTNFMALLF